MSPSSPIAPDTHRICDFIFGCVVFLTAARPILLFFYCDPTTTMRRRWRALPMLVFFYLVDVGIRARG